MATTTKKGSKNKKAKLRAPVVNTSVAEQAQTNAELRQKLAECLQREQATAIENVRLFQELKESLEQQTATSEILRVIRSSPSDVQAVMDVIAETAARLCGASDAQISRVAGNVLRRVASYGSMPTPSLFGEGYPFNRGEVGGRATLDRQTIRIHDITTEFDTEFPQSGGRSILMT